MMRSLLIATTLALSATVVVGSCPNLCSGHGTCGQNDLCTCYSNFQGSDCSERTCTFSLAWADAPTATSAHNYAECGGRGTCDRASGLCECQLGYAGDGCTRTGCFNGCSGHGTCDTMSELAGDAAVAYNAWDSAKQQGCKCDAGFTGIYCETRMCPKGNDPLTMMVDGCQATTTSVEANEVQNVTVQANMGVPMNGGSVTFTFTDVYNGVWTTRPMDLPQAHTITNTAPLATGTCTATVSTTQCKVGRLTTAASGYPGLEGASVELYLAADTYPEHREATVDGGDGQLTFVTAASTHTTGSTYSVNGVMSTVANGWHIAQTTGPATVYVTALATASDGVIAATISGALDVAKSAAFALRMGDYINIGTALSTTGTTGNCLMEVAADYVTAATTIYLVADDSVATCDMTGGFSSTLSILFTQWQIVQSATKGYNGVDETVTAFDASTGTLTFSADNAAGTLYQQLPPGSWIRLFRSGDPDQPYCDMQLNDFTYAYTANAGTDITRTVDTTSMTATTAGGSYLCATWSSYTDVGAAHIKDYQLVQKTNVFPVVANTGTETIAVASGTITVVDQVDNTDVGFLKAGTLVYVLNDAIGVAAAGLICAGVISADVTAAGTPIAITTVAPPTIAGVSPTSCTTVTQGALQTLRLMVFAENSIRYEVADTTNTYNFGHLQIGDTVRLSNPKVGRTTSQASNMAANFQITAMDTAAASTRISFARGSKPNGGGMHPAMTVMGLTDCAPDAAAADGTHAGADGYVGKARIADAGCLVMLGPSFVVQPVVAAKAMANTAAASSWLSTDAAVASSAADVKRVLEGLPNQVIDTVDVTMTSNTVGLYAYSVTFTGARTTGNQNEIVMNARGCSTDGCQPRYSGVNIQSAFALDDAYYTANTITSAADKADMSSLITAGDSVIVYTPGTQAGATYSGGVTAETTSVSTTAVGVDGTLTAAGTSTYKLHAGVLVLKNKEDYNTATGSTPYFTSVTTEITRGTKESAECSGRGICAGETGVCECFPGYTGEACDIQTTIM